MLPLRRIREAKGLSGKQVAEAAGTTEQSMSRIEREKQPLTLDMMRKLRDVLGVPISQLVGESPYGHDQAPAKDAPPMVRVTTAARVVEALELYLAEMGRGLGPHDKAEAVETLLEWALDNPDLVTDDAGIDAARFRAFIKHLVRGA